MTKKDIQKLEEAIKHIQADKEEDCECDLCYRIESKSFLDGLEQALFLLDNKELDRI